MTNFQLKILALTFMTIDHIGYILDYNSPEYIIFRAIGRLSFPIFLFLILEGFKYTSNIKKYILSLYIFGVISILPFYFLFGTKLNVFFTLGNIVTMLLCFKYTSNNVLQLFIFIIFLIISKNADWGIVAITTIYFLRNHLYDNSIKIYLPVGLFFAFLLNLTFEINILSLNTLSLYKIAILSISILFSIPILLSYNGKLGLKLTGLKKYFFYAYYPLHLLILGYINNIILS